MADLIVIGAGRAGCEAALCGARMGLDTLLLTLSLESVSLMPCNPFVGGKGAFGAGSGRLRRGKGGIS